MTDNDLWFHELIAEWFRSMRMRDAPKIEKPPLIQSVIVRGKNAEGKEESTYSLTIHFVIGKEAVPFMTDGYSVLDSQSDFLKFRAEMANRFRKMVRKVNQEIGKELRREKQKEKMRGVMKLVKDDG